LGFGFTIGPIRLKPAGLSVIRESIIDDLSMQSTTVIGIFNRKQNLHTAIQIAMHEVGAAEIDLVVAAVFEQVNSGMLQKSTQNANNTDVLTQARHSRSKAADATNNQRDRYAGIGGVVKLFN